MQVRCYSYIRFSSTEQRKGDSFRRQTAYAEQYAEDNGLLLDDTLKIADLGLSAFHGDHRTKGALGVFLEEVKSGCIPPGSHLVIEALDRLTREDILEAVNLFTGLLLKDIVICTAADSMVFRKDDFHSGYLMMSVMKLAQGHEESLKKQQRLFKSWEVKRANSNIKKLTATSPAWLKLSKDRTNFLIIPERAEVVKIIFEMKNSGIGIERIAKTLNKSDYWKPQNPRVTKIVGWGCSYINKILRNKAVIGEFQPWSSVGGTRHPVGEPIKKYFPRIISDEIFYAVQEQFSINIGKGGKNGKFHNLFSAIAKCGYCGAPMQLINKGILRHVVDGKYLICDKARRAIGCNYDSVRYQSFEKLVLMYCQGLDLSNILPDIKKSTSDILKMQNILSGIMGEILDKQKRIKNITNAIEENSDKNARNFLNTRLNGLIKKFEELKNEEQQLVSELSKLNSSNSETEKQLNNIKGLILKLADASPDVRASLRAKLRSLIDRIDIYPVGKPRMTPELVEELIQVMLDILPETTQADVEKERAKLLAKIGNKELATCDIFFRNGSIRNLNLSRKPEMPMEIDRIAGRGINRIINKDGIEENIIFTKR